MKRSLQGKKRTWTLLWGCSCIVAAGAMAFFAASRPTGCTVKELTHFPAAVMVSGEDSSEEASPEETTEKRVCLTFDDGPSSTTESILKVLKEKQVPATFFVIAAPNNEEYLKLIAKEAAEGHQIALHSCSHEYSKIYSSTSDFWADIKQLREKISPYVDVEQVHWLRFPGGSTNTVSHKYGGSGIMKSLKKQAKEKGYQYVDWNVCAEDAVGGHPSASEILENVIQEAEGKDRCVVLMHDTKATKTTAEALPGIIDWFKEQGYTFCRVEELDSAAKES